MNKKYIQEVNRLKKIEIEKKGNIDKIIKEMEIKSPRTQSELIAIIQNVTKSKDNNVIRYYFQKCTKMHFENLAKSYNQSKIIKGAH